MPWKKYLEAIYMEMVRLRCIEKWLDDNEGTKEKYYCTVSSTESASSYSCSLL